MCNVLGRKLIFHFNSWLSFQRLCRLLRGYINSKATVVSAITLAYGERWLAFRRKCVFWANGPKEAKSETQTERTSNKTSTFNVYQMLIFW